MYITVISIFYIKILLKNIKHLQSTKIHITFYKNNLFTV